MRSLILLLVVVCLAQNLEARAETIFEPFDSNPLSHGWTETHSKSTWTYSTGSQGGWLRAHFQGDPPGTLNRYSKALSTPISASTEFWMESDVVLLEVPGSYNQHRNVSGLYGNETNNQVTSIVQSYVYMSGTDVYAHFGRTYNSSGTVSDRSCFDSTGKRTPYPDRYEYVVRAKFHNFGNGYAQLDMYDLNLDPTASGEPWMSTKWNSNGNIPVNTGASLLHWFGIGSMNSTAAYFQDLNIDNLYFSTEQEADDYFEDLGQPRPRPSWIVSADSTPPTPNPMTFSVDPVGTRPGEVYMRATTASDENIVQYSFENLAVPGHNSGWRDNPEWTDTGLNTNTSYSYRVKARDIPAGNETAWSAAKSVTTPKDTDFDAPTPNPLTWAKAPTVFGGNNIMMVASTATDAENNPVEYYFGNVTDPSRDSGWQSSPTYSECELTAGVTNTYRVKCRDASFNHNESGWSPEVSVTTLSSQQFLAEYLRKSLSWKAPDLGFEVPVKVYHKETNNIGQPAPVIVYVMNHGYPRVGQESDASILADYIDQSYLVVTVDFGSHPGATSPTFDFDLLKLQRAVYGYQTPSIVSDVSLEPQENHCWFLPAGCRLQRDVVFFELDKHGSYGTKERVLSVWNSTIKTKFGVPTLTDPEAMYNPDGSPIDYRLSLDIVYPSQPTRKLPLFVYNSTQSIRMRCFRKELDEPQMIGFAMRGYAAAIIDHCWNPLARHWAYGYFDGGYSLDDWNGLKSETAAIRFFRAQADTYGIDTNLVCVMGYSKGAYGVTRLADPDHETQGEYYKFTGFPDGSPEPQPWLGYSSKITAGYQATGNGTRRSATYVQSRQVPTITAAGKFDEYDFWPVFPSQVQIYESRDVNHLAIWMHDLGHILAYRFDPWLDRDRYALVAQFFDQYMKPHDNPAPEVLYTYPINHKTGVTSKGYSQAIPDLSLLPPDALNYVAFKEPITVHFAPQIDVNSATNGGIRVVRKSDNTPIAGTWRATRGDTVFKFTPSAHLNERTAYQIIVTTNVVNKLGVPVAREKISEFQTGSRVHLEELEQFCDKWLQPVPADSPLDYDGNGVVDFRDFVVFGKTWGQEQ